MWTIVQVLQYCSHSFNLIKHYSQNLIHTVASQFFITVTVYICVVLLMSHTLQLLNEGNTSLKKVQSFQGGIPETYREENPLAGILSTVYVVSQ